MGGDKREITFNVVRANDIKPFTLPDGTRHIGYHFFYLKDNTWQFRWIEIKTDPEWLQAKIQEGLIYVFDF